MIFEETDKELRKELAGEDEQPDYTIREFADVYLEEYCKVRNTCVDFKEERLKTIKNIVGDLKLREFASAHAAYSEKERAKDVVPRTGKPISKATINRGLGRVQSHVHIRTEEEIDRSTSDDPIRTFTREREGPPGHDA